MKKELRLVEVTYNCGDVIKTDMAPHVTDEEILRYFAIGRVFNLGNGEHDRMSSVKSVRIIK